MSPVARRGLVWLLGGACYFHFCIATQFIKVIASACLPKISCRSDVREKFKTKTGHFNPKKFEDRYEDSLKELLRKKEKGEKIEAPRERESGKVINLMDALRRSAKGEQATRGSRVRNFRRTRNTHKEDASGSTPQGQLNFL